MGNKKSTLKTHSHEDTDESDSDDEERKVILEIAEREYCEDVEFLCQDCEKCCDLYGSELIPVEDLSLCHLPVALRSQQVLDYILTQEKIAVKLEVKKITGNSKFVDASGWACVSEDSAVEYAVCPIENCPVNEGNSHKAYGGITVFTNEHVVTKKEEGVNCKVTFFYDGRGNVQDKETVQAQEDVSDNPRLYASDLLKLTRSCIDGVAWGLCVKQVRENKDLVAIEIIYHDVNLFKVIAASSVQRLNAWTQIPEALKKVMKEHVIVISHPHGRRKVVSVGKLICLEEGTQEEKLKKETRYLAATCKGSSGAPVISGHYPYRPFTHSSKLDGKTGFENFSLSY
ncbi:hypothetical protein ElyMa_005235700 [Elysia marginata]|uniref:Peptidase S1 domain-containing protein n=1 Tax=Elysia marginata TaxID=1093978 RepID=A0AAV4JWJ6_9GAST|nr:hypothetical protein ElyMa_005235700 [Elysia marginata]